MTGGFIGGNLGGAFQGVGENLRVMDLREPAYHFGVMTKRLRQAVSGLAGHVGVDFVVHGREVRVLEVNPMLTTSYAGLHRSLGVNPVPDAASLFTYPPASRLSLVASAPVKAAL